MERGEIATDKKVKGAFGTWGVAMRVKWTRKALSSLDDAVNFNANNKPIAVHDPANRI